MTVPIELIKAWLIREGKMIPISQSLSIPIAAGKTISIVLDTGGNIFMPDMIHIRCSPSGALALSVIVDGLKYFEVDACSYDSFPDILDFSRMGWPWVARKAMEILVTNISTSDAELELTYTGGLMPPDAYALFEEKVLGKVRAWLESRSKEEG